MLDKFMHMISHDKYAINSDRHIIDNDTAFLVESFFLKGMIGF